MLLVQLFVSFFAGGALVTILSIIAEKTNQTNRRHTNDVSNHVGVGLSIFRVSDKCRTAGNKMFITSGASS